MKRDNETRKEPRYSTMFDEGGTNSFLQLVASACRASCVRAPKRLSRYRCSVIFCGSILLLFADAGNAADNIGLKSFRCITQMTPVRGFYVDNIMGNLAATLAVANSATGGTYPAGSLIQLVPTEAMVKRAKGFNPVTHDWEFFELDVSKQGTTIRKRGFSEVVNRFGGNCFGCHIEARPQWDFICETDHGCAPIQTTRRMIGALQRTDPRCPARAVSPEDAEALKELSEIQRPAESSTKK